MNYWILIIILYSTNHGGPLDAAPKAIEGFTKDGCIAAAAELNKRGHGVRAHCVEKK